MTRLATEGELEEELLRLYRKWSTLGYRASRFYQTFTKGCKRYKGSVNTVTDTVSKYGTSQGFDRLREMGRLDLTLEKRIVLNPQWSHLFSLRLCNFAALKLEQAKSK